MTTPYRESNTISKDLKPLLTGQLILPQDEAYHQACQIWNGRVNKQPAALVRCADAQDVIHTVRWTRTHGLELSVLGGGHDFAGRALCDRGIVIDCSHMKEVIIDSEVRTARVQPGATVGDLIDTAHKDGLVTSTGNVAGVGLAGLTLGGGYGPLVGKLGLVADNLLSAQVVTADGNLVTASATEDAALLWGLRGGGGNFGAVVSLEYRLHPLTKVLSGWLLYPLAQAREVLRFYSEFIKTAPDELTILAGFFTLPEGMPVLFLSPTYCGSLEEGEQVLKPLCTFGKPLANQVQPTSYEILINAINPLVPKGRYYFMQTQSIEALSNNTIDVIVDLAQQFSSPFSAITIHHFHGAASRVPVSQTAFALRQDHLMVEISAAWELSSANDDQRHIQWAQEGSRALAPYALKGGYINLLGEHEQDRVLLALAPHYERLLELKRAYDPDDIFHSTIGHIELPIST
jgi:FAD/FMN-containing dehydrogenase